MRLPATSYFVAVVEPQLEVVGFSNGGPSREQVLPQAGELYAIYIRDAYQGRGIGRRLFRAVVDETPDGMNGRACSCGFSPTIPTAASMKGSVEGKLRNGRSPWGQPGSLRSRMHGTISAACNRGTFRSARCFDYPGSMWLVRPQTRVA